MLTRVLNQCIQQIDSDDVNRYLSDVFITDFQDNSFANITNIYRIFETIKSQPMNIIEKKDALNLNRYRLQKIILAVFNEDLPSNSLSLRDDGNGYLIDFELENVWNAFARNKTILKTKKLRELNIRVYCGASNKNSYRDTNDLDANLDIIITTTEKTFLNNYLGISSAKDLLIVNDCLTENSIFKKHELLLASALLNYEKLDDDAVNVIEDYLSIEISNWEESSKTFRQIIDKLEKCLLH